MPSPRDVPTYDHKPAMSAYEVTDQLVRRLQVGDFDFVVVNFANADMLGHTGVISAAVEAIEAVDECVGRLTAAVGALGGVCLITSDHGNADHMLEPAGGANTAHSTNRVPLIATVPGVRVRPDGRLCDVAPTVLALMGIAPPPVMTGTALLEAAR